MTSNSPPNNSRRASTSPPSNVVKTYCRRRAKRARIDRPPCSTDTSIAWRDWESLACGPAELIAERLLSDDAADYLRFRAVCSSWRRCSSPPRGCLDRLFQPRRWIMLRPSFATPERRGFLNVSTGERVQVDLPELRGHHVCGPTSEGLIVLCDKESYAVRLLNPLTRQRTDLPDAATMLYVWKMPMNQRARLENLHMFHAGVADDATVALFFDHRELAVARPGDERWTRLNEPWTSFNGSSPVLAMLPFAGRLYCGIGRAVKVVRTGARSKRPWLAVAAKLPGGGRVFSCSDSVSLVDNDGELILVHGMPPTDCLGERFEVRRVDLDAGTTVPGPCVGSAAVPCSSRPGPLPGGPRSRCPPGCPRPSAPTPSTRATAQD